MEKTIINWEEVSLNIIKHAGEAKIEALSSLKFLKMKKWMHAENKIRLAEQKLTNASIEHADIVSAEANGQKLEYKLLFIHAEDQLMATETSILLIKEMIAVFKTFNS